ATAGRMTPHSSINFSRPFHGSPLILLCSPSNELLGYFQSSASRTHLPKQVTPIVIDAVLVQQLDELLFECSLPMMLFLVVDVGDGAIRLRGERFRKVPRPARR